MKDNKDKKGFLVRDIIVILICIIAIAALVFILKSYNDTQNSTQEELNVISEQIQQGEYVLSTGTSNSSSTYSGIMFNEINQEGWIELYNSSNETNLSGMSLLVDDETVLTIDSDMTLGKNSLLMIETDRELETGERHIVTLFDENGDIVRALIVPELEKAQSYGCVTDGSTRMSYISATKGESNTGDAIIDETTMSFSVPGGFYQGVIDLEINVPDGMTVYYTLDATTPTTESTIYETPISITNRSGSNYSYAAKETENNHKPSSVYMGTVVRAILVDSQGNIQQELTSSYYIGIGSNSDMVNIPVISITTDPDNLFDYFEGIYVKGRKYEDDVALASGGANANYYQEWRKTAHIEYFEANKDKTYEGDVEIKVVNDYSTTAAQKSFRIYGDGGWSGSSLEQFFNNNKLAFTLQTNKRDNNSKAREYLVNELLEDTSVGTAKLTPCTVFIDGEYWGLYTIAQTYDARYFEENYGITDEKVIVAKQGMIDDYEYVNEYTDFYNYITSLDMTDEANYQWAKDNMDIQSYLDYFCANMYLANVDYGTEEAYTWKTASVGNSTYADGKWRWILGRLDNTMANSKANGASSSSIDTFLQTGVREDMLFRTLLGNEEFRKQLKATIQNMIDDVFEPSKVEEKLSEISSSLSKAATESYERFSASASDDFYTNEIKTIQNFFDERGEYMAVYASEIDGLEERFEEYEAPDEDTSDQGEENEENEEADDENDQNEQN